MVIVVVLSVVVAVGLVALLVPGWVDRLEGRLSPTAPRDLTPPWRGRARLRMRVIGLVLVVLPGAGILLSTTR